MAARAGEFLSPLRLPVPDWNNPQPGFVCHASMLTRRGSTSGNLLSNFSNKFHSKMKRSAARIHE
jgi:hypothetical protein